MGRSFPVMPPGKHVAMLLVLLTLVLPLAVMGGVTVYVGLPGQVAAQWALSCATAVVVGVGIGLLFAVRRLGIALENGCLMLRATLYSLRVEVRALDLGAARIVSLDRHPEFAPRFKSNGFALPGLYAGNFRGWPLSKRFFCLLTRRESVLVLPEVGGRVLLLSPERPQALLDALRAEAK